MDAKTRKWSEITVFTVMLIIAIILIIRSCTHEQPPAKPALVESYSRPVVVAPVNDHFPDARKKVNRHHDAGCPDMSIWPCGCWQRVDGEWGKCE